MRVKELFLFIRERHAIYTRRIAGQPKPWTADSILQRYRFCNVYRELDKVTVWIRENWREPHAADPELWFTIVVARMFNLPTTLQIIKYPVPFKLEQIRGAVQKIQAEGLTAYSAAYMIRCDCQEAGKTKVDYLVDKVFASLWKERARVRPHRADTLATFHARLMSYYGLGSFMAAQVVADTKFAPPLSNATDWWTWAAPGPGSLKGMNYVLGLPSSAKHPAGVWEANLKVLQTKIDPLVREAGMPRISAQDLQNCLCEFSKYEKARLGEGRPKQRYPGTP
jgi:alpha-glutamyl/putrescinyl thymine pyrophosphorylase clade 1